MKNIERLGREIKIRSYNLLEHSFMVAVLFSKFANKEDIPYDMQVFKLVLHHDIIETITGDLPYPVKNLNRMTEDAWDLIEKEVAISNPRFNAYTDIRIENEMSPLQYKLFKACDMLELWIFVKEEQALGNGSIEMEKVRLKAESILGEQFKSIDEFMKNFTV